MILTARSFAVSLGWQKQPGIVPCCTNTIVNGFYQSDCTENYIALVGLQYGIFSVSKAHVVTEKVFG